MSILLPIVSNGWLDQVIEVRTATRIITTKARVSVVVAGTVGPRNTVESKSDYLPPDGAGVTRVARKQPLVDSSSIGP